MIFRRGHANLRDMTLAFNSRQKQITSLLVFWTSGGSVTTLDSLSLVEVATPAHDRASLRDIVPPFNPRKRARQIARIVQKMTQSIFGPAGDRTPDLLIANEAFYH